MGANNIQFKIGTSYNGEGFKRARNDITEVNNNVKKGAAAVGQLQGALGEMDAGAAKALGAMTGLAQAILSFNVTAIATQVAIFSINRYFGELKEKAEAAQKKAEELKASMEKAFSSAIQGRISGINKEVKSISDDFERVTKQANQFAAALEGVRSAEANGGIVKLQVEKLNALLEAHSDEQRANIEAAYNLKIAIQKSADTETAWQAKIDAAHQAVVDNENRKAKIDEQIATLNEERRSLEETMLVAKASGDHHWLDIQKQVTYLWEQEQALEQKKLDVESQTDVLRLDEQKIKAEANAAQGQATIEIRNAELAEKKLNEAKDARRVKEDKAREAADMKAAADLIDAQETETAAEIQKRVNDSAKALEAAQTAYAKQLESYNAYDIIADAAKAASAKGTLAGGKNLLPVDVQKSIQTRTADAQVDDAVRNGMVTTVKDMGRLQRQAMRDARDAISKNQGQALREAQRYKRLQEMNPKALCSSDKEFMAKYEKIQAAAEKRKKDLADAKKAVDESKKAQEESAKNLKDIKTQLDKLGLK